MVKMTPLELVPLIFVIFFLSVTGNLFYCDLSKKAATCDSKSMSCNQCDILTKPQPQIQDCPTLPTINIDGIDNPYYSKFIRSINNLSIEFNSRQVAQIDLTNSETNFSLCGDDRCGSSLHGYFSSSRGILLLLYDLDNKSNSYQFFTDNFMGNRLNDDCKDFPLSSGTPTITSTLTQPKGNEFDFEDPIFIILISIGVVVVLIFVALCISACVLWRKQKAQKPKARRAKSISYRRPLNMKTAKANRKGCCGCLSNRPSDNSAASKTTVPFLDTLPQLTYATGTAEEIPSGVEAEEMDKTADVVKNAEET